MNEPIKPFQRHGNFTIFDNMILDIVMPQLSSAGWKMLCLIMRKTLGWHKNEDALSYTQLQTGTGFGSFSTVSKALKELEDAGLIIPVNTEKWSANRYQLNRDYALSTTESVVEPTTDNVVEPTTESVDTKEREKKINSSSDFSEAVAVYESEIAVISPGISVKIQEAIDKHPAGWTVEAIHTAASANKRSWSYIAGILRNWERNGYPAGRQNGTGTDKFTQSIEDEAGGYYV